MTLFVKYIAAIISSFSLLFSTTGLSLLHHICMHSGNQEVTLLFESPTNDECGDDNSCCAVMNEAKDNTHPLFTMLDCCKEFSDYSVISIAYVSQNIEKFSSYNFLNEGFLAVISQKIIDNSENYIIVKPPGILNVPVSNIISYILHSTDISSELPA